jgi:hypothetical protein
MVFTFMLKKTVEQILERMAVVHPLCDFDREGSEVYFEEYRNLLSEAKERLDSTIGLMVRAGLFTVYHEISKMGYGVSDVFDNGNYWLCADKFPCITPAGAGDDDKFSHN